MQMREIALPAEFKVFSWGVNESDNGTCIYDERSHVQIMMHRGLRKRVQIDLEHLALDPYSEDRDARGWGTLQARNDGLWLVDVEWTPDGVRRLSEGTQQYISPAFRDDADGRVIELVNVALTALPASYNLPPLTKWSLSATANESSMDLNALKEALGLSPDADMSVLMAALKAVADELAAEGGGEEEAEEMADEEEAEEMADSGEDAEEYAEEGDDEKKLSSAAHDLAALVSQADRRIKRLEREALLQRYSSRLTPALKAWARDADPDVLRSLLPTLPKATPRVQSRPSATPRQVEAWSTDDEAAARAVAKATGRRYEDVKARVIASRNGGGEK